MVPICGAPEYGETVPLMVGGLSSRELKRMRPPAAPPPPAPWPAVLLPPEVGLVPVVVLEKPSQ
jgi:hypothetical protein